MFRVMDVAAGEKKDLDLLGSCCVDLNFYFLFNMLRRPIAASTTPASSLIPAEIQVSDHPCQRLTPRVEPRAGLLAGGKAPWDRQGGCCVGGAPFGSPL